MMNLEQLANYFSKDTFEEYGVNQGMLGTWSGTSYVFLPQKERDPNGFTQAIHVYGDFESDLDNTNLVQTTKTGDEDKFIPAKGFAVMVLRQKITEECSTAVNNGEIVVRFLPTQRFTLIGASMTIMASGSTLSVALTNNNPYHAVVVRPDDILGVITFDRVG